MALLGTGGQLLHIKIKKEGCLNLIFSKLGLSPVCASWGNSHRLASKEACRHERLRGQLPLAHYITMSSMYLVQSYG